jgi:hypothetical protein
VCGARPSGATNVDVHVASSPDLYLHPTHKDSMKIKVIVYSQLNIFTPYNGRETISIKVMF